jgi:uncharacterized protein YeeX (DUF496 family)
LSRYFYLFSLFSVVFAAFFLFSYKADLPADKDTSIIGYSRTIQNELEFLRRTINSFTGNEDSLQMKELILLSGITIKKNVDSLTPSCNKAVSLKINDFTLKVMESIGSLSNTEVFPEEVEVLKTRLEKDSRVLSNIVQLAADKYLEKIQQDTRSGVFGVIDRFRQLSLFLLLLSLIMTGRAFFQERRLKKFILETGISDDLSGESIKKAIESIKDDGEKHYHDVERLLEREQMVGKRKDVLLDAIPAGLFSCDSKGRVTLMNSKIRSWFEIVEDMSGEEVKRIFSKMGIDEEHREKFKYKGEIFWISEHRSSSEQFYVVTNITEQEEMSRKLLDSERLVSIGEMASRITHEIRNPLSTVKLNSEYMVENIDKMDTSEMHSSLKLIVHEVERLESITEKYMDIVRYRNSEETEKFVNLPVDLIQF